MSRLLIYEPCEVATAARIETEYRRLVAALGADNVPGVVSADDCLLAIAADANHCTRRGARAMWGERRTRSPWTGSRGRCTVTGRSR